MSTTHSARDLSKGQSFSEVHPTRWAIVALLAGCTPAAINQASSNLDQTVLGNAQSFAVLGGQSVTNTGSSVINGNLGVDPGLTVTGFPPGLVVGTTHAGDAVALQAQTDTTIAYNTLAGQSVTLDLSGQDLGGMTLVAGVYHYASSAQLTGVLTLDAQNDPTATFVFQIGSTLTTASNSSIVVINGARDCNIFFQVGSSATVGTTTLFKGNILALTSITVTTGAAISGRVLARNGSVTLDTNAISTLACAAIVPDVDAGAGSGSGSGSGHLDAGVDACATMPIDAPAPIDAAIDCAGTVDARPL